MSEENEKIDKKTKAYALEVETKLKEFSAELGPSYWSRAELISEVHKKSLWSVLGYKTAQAYREYLLIPKGTWFERRRLWDLWAEPALSDEKITRAKLNRMRSQNVKQLLRLDARRKFDARWIEKALNMTEGQLEAEVDHVLQNQEDPEYSLNKPEAKALLKISMSVSQKEFILQTMDRYAKVNALNRDDEAKILEEWAAEISSGLPVENMAVDQQEPEEPAARTMPDREVRAS